MALAPLEAPLGANQHPGPNDLGLVMGGGGARAAYQVGFLRCLARLFPELSVPYITGVSAGAINAALLASHDGTFLQATRELSGLWENLRVQDVFRTDTRALLGNGINWLRQLVSGGIGKQRLVKGLVDTQPLLTYLTEALDCSDGKLTGVQSNLDRGRLRAFAISTTSYSTGQSVTWIQGRDVQLWERPQHQTRTATIGVEHIMASSALPMFFPAARIENSWYGDGGIRLMSPLSPAIHLGARRIIAISTRYGARPGEPREPEYPPPAQVLGVLLNSIFLDFLDHDATRLNRINELISALPEDKRVGLKPVQLLTLRPSVDLAKIAGQFEAQLPWGFRFLSRGLGTKEERSHDFLSMILFQRDYLSALIEIGEQDAEARADEIEAFLSITEPEDDPALSA